ncbi:HK97 gp10 family phage protein [Orbus wheelerorum]|uniref:HK97-gp10 family putative phage morphogenesis protein n=1 Tax=Orbus wheelerorum TaxID=3074111 RepID=UPI00370D8C59
MANSVSFDLSGLKVLKRDLKRLSKPEKNKVMRKGLKKGVDLLRDEVKKRTPVRKGILKKDIKSRSTARTGEVYIKGGRLSEQKANWLEYGTSKMAPHPFIRPAFDTNQSKAENLCITGIITAIDEVFMK